MVHNLRTKELVFSIIPSLVHKLSLFVSHTRDYSFTLSGPKGKACRLSREALYVIGDATHLYSLPQRSLKCS